MAVLEVDNLSLRIGEAQILNEVSFTVTAGETVGLIGPNGSGKTTLFNCISGFVRGGRGKVEYLGRDLATLAPAARAMLGVGRVFQNCGIFREMTVGENLLTALESRQSPWRSCWPWQHLSRQNRAVALDYLREIQLADQFEVKAGCLSGGQLRLLEIMRTLAFGADLFLLDEPTAGVAPRLKENIAALIGKLQQFGKTVLVIEHDISFIQTFCSRIIVLDVGRVVLDDTPAQVRSSELLKDIYFGSSLPQAVGS